VARPLDEIRLDEAVLARDCNVVRVAEVTSAGEGLCPTLIARSLAFLTRLVLQVAASLLFRPLMDDALGDRLGADVVRER
jgi:hypothetical protein